jgi:STE24 endopeptidase
VAAGALAAYLLLPTEVPGDLRSLEPAPERYFTSSQLEEARDYDRFLRVLSLLSLVVLVAVLAIYAAKGAAFTRESAAGRIGTGMLLGMLGFAVVWLAQLPFGLAALWWERRHDVSRVGYLDWIVESWLALGATFLFVCVAIVIVMALARPLRESWWIAGAPVFVGLGLLFAFVTPFLIPDVRDARNERLRAEANVLARAQDLPEIRVDVAEVQEYTTEPNAAAAGLGPSRRVILWDTLLQRPFDRGEIRFVLAHELAHHSRDHIWKGFGWYALFAVVTAFLIAVATRGRGGMYEARAVPVALLVAVLAQVAIAPAEGVISRRAETEADWVALETTRDPASAREAFVDLARTSLADPRPPAWSYLLGQTHPSIMKRIGMTEAWRRRDARSPR